MKKEIEKQLNKLEENTQIMNNLKEEKNKIIEEELNSEEILNIFKKQEQDKIIKAF